MKVSNRDLWNAGALYGDPKLIGAHEPPAKRRNDNPEGRMMHAAIAALRCHPKVAWVVRVNSGAYKTPDGRFIRFGFQGCPDILGQMKDGRILMVECKSEVGRLTEDQKAVLANVKANGGVAGMARSVDEALAIVEGSL